MSLETLKGRIRLLLEDAFSSISVNDINNLINPPEDTEPPDIDGQKTSGYYFTVSDEGENYQINSLYVSNILKAYESITTRLEKYESSDMRIDIDSFKDLTGLLNSVHMICEEGGYENFSLNGDDVIYHSKSSILTDEASIAFNVCNEILYAIEAKRQ